jgi:hypothetical protein
MRPLQILGIAWTALLWGCGSSSPEQQASAPDAASYGACSVSRLSLPLIEAGKEGKLGAALVRAEPNPPAKHDNTWSLEVKDPSGAPLDDAELVFAETYMPVHDHAGVPEPSAEPAGPAAFRVRVPFMMRGPWEVRLDLRSQRAGSDRVVFEVCVAE